MTTKIIQILAIFILIYNTALAQNNVPAILPIQDFITKVKAQHPLAKVANIQVLKANANLLAAKGGFDPTANITASNKTFDSKNYYYYNNAAVTLPLPIGNIKTGIENNGGQYLENEITSGRSSYLGIEVPLLNGLLIDKRRAFLQQAKIAIQLNTAAQKELINDLLLEAYTTYYQWAGAYKMYNVFSGYVQISSDRLQLVKTGVVNGDRPAMDTTEALTQLQNFELLKNDASIKLTTAILELNNFIWDDNQVPQNIAENVIPDTLAISSAQAQKILPNLLQSGLLQNPAIQQYNFKIKDLEVEKKLKYQSLLPTINLKANLLNRDYNIVKNFGSTLLENNNRWGIDIKIPLRFREARGSYNIAKLKIEETNLVLKQKLQETENKIKTYYNQYILLQQQLIIANQTYTNFNSLLRNEKLRFTNGESSLFLVNTRENKVLETEQKIIDINVKLIKAAYTLDWAAGTIQ